ncbi:MAG: hypothetical protein ACETV1_04235 [Candidatus Bathyarchaeia archaeon]
MGRGFIQETMNRVKGALKVLKPDSHTERLITLVRGKTILGVLLISFMVRFSLFCVDGYEIDLSTFYAWFYNAAEYGPQDFYTVTWCDYPPFNVYIFLIFGHLGKCLSLFGKSSTVYIVKLPSNLFDIATSFLIFNFLRRRVDVNSPLAITSLYAFNPATIFNTSIWGQYDAIYTFFLIVSLLSIIDSKLKLSVIALTIGILTKPQSIALAPLIGFLIAEKYRWKGMVTAVLVSAATLFVLIIPFRWGNPLDFLLKIYLEGYGTYSFNSINAFNVWAFAGFWKTDTEPFLFFLNSFTIGWIMFGALMIFSLYTLHKGTQQEARLIFSAFILLVGFFMLPTRIHERYLFPAFSFLILTLPFIKQARPIYGALTLTYLSNQAYVLLFLNAGRFIPDLDPFVWIVSMANLAAFLYSLLIMSNGKIMSKGKMEKT